MGERILVVDDDPAIGYALQRAFGYEGHSVRVALTGEEALAAVDAEIPAVVLLDVLLPGIDGLEVCRRLRRDHPALPILMLTARDSPADEIAGLELGANDYVTKPFDPDVLQARVRSLLRLRREGGTAALEFADLRLDAGTRAARRGERAIDLTTTEYRLLRLFMSQPRQVMAKEQILERVWGYDFGGSTNVVEVYVGGLRRKLEAGGEPRLIHTVRGAGYALREA